MPSATIEQVIANARALVQSSQSDKAVELLAPLVPGNETNVALLQIYGEVLLEVNELEQAYDVLLSACELDKDASQGSEKFFYLGQIIGGSDGIKYLDTGLRKLDTQLGLVKAEHGHDDPVLVELAKVYDTKELLVAFLIKKLNQGIFAKIEIWMTDLCMEPEAERQCDELIGYSLSLDAENPEALSLLASIRISQQRPDEAKELVMKSWALFQQKKTALEEAATSHEASDSLEVGLEYIELIQPLLTLARFCIELELYDLAVSIASNTQDINEDILEAHYYEALAHLFSAKKAFAQAHSSDADYRDLSVEEVKSHEFSKSALEEAKSALTQGYKIINSDAGSEADPDVVEQVNEMLGELGGPSMADLLPPRHEDEDGWEDEIEDD